jgi:glycerol kinase
MGKRYLLAIDQGTSSSRVLIYDERLTEVASAQQEFRQYYPKPGWVEHDAGEIWESVAGVLESALGQAGIRARDVAAIGITNQRETAVMWDRATGEPVTRAIVWQDRRTADRCRELREQGVEAALARKTGLRLDPYFSATKIEWILRNVDGVRARAAAGELAFGTIDSFLIWRLTGGTRHVTDATNASRTLLFNIHTQAWDEELLELFGVPRPLLPEVLDNVADFGVATGGVFDTAVPIGGVAGDQQAALIGQAGFAPGTIKSTFGTGCFVIANTGSTVLESANQLLATIASRIGGRVTYGLEGSVFVAGSAVQWLRDSLGIVESAPETERIAAATGVVEDVVVVPAFAGLGAPYWDPYARGAILGLTRGTGSAEIVTATLQAIAYQTCDLIRAMKEDGIDPGVIRVDGGMVANDWFLQFLADVLGMPVERPVNVESTVLGAACLAALSSGILASTDDIADLWQCERRFEPDMPGAQRKALLAGWADAVSRVRGAR